MVLEARRISKSEKQAMKLLRTNKVRGTWHKAFPEAAKKLRLPYLCGTDGNFALMKKMLKQRYVIIIGYIPQGSHTDHYAVIKKITLHRIYFLDPYHGEDHGYAPNTFQKIWKSDPRYEKENRWYFAIKKV